MTEPTFPIFVYGTLRRGEANHHLLGHARFLRATRTAPAFELVDLGAYPGLRAGGRTAVAGEAFLLDADALGVLDRFEGHPDLFVRTPIDLEDGTRAEAYLVHPDGPQGVVVPSGDWRLR